MMADCFDLDLDEVKFSYEFGACTKDVDLGWYLLPKGSLGGNYIKYQGLVDGVPRVETHLEWQMTPHTDPSWDIKGCYITQIKGDPCVYNKHMIFPKPGVDLSNPDNFASIGMTVTGLPALNAIVRWSPPRQDCSPAPTCRCGGSRADSRRRAARAAPASLFCSRLRIPCIEH